MADLDALEALLLDALASIDSRFFATGSQRAAYHEALGHIAQWRSYEQDDDRDDELAFKQGYVQALTAAQGYADAHDIDAGWIHEWLKDSVREQTKEMPAQR